jgi:hypothetical protein
VARFSRPTLSETKVNWLPIQLAWAASTTTMSVINRQLLPEWTATTASGDRQVDKGMTTDHLDMFSYHSCPARWTALGLETGS